MVHEAVLTNLAPNTQYYYRVGDNVGGWSSVFSFTTLPSDIGSTARPLRIAQIGDMGYGPHSDATVATIAQWVKDGKGGSACGREGEPERSRKRSRYGVSFRHVWHVALWWELHVFQR